MPHLGRWARVGFSVLFRHWDQVPREDVVYVEVRESISTPGGLPFHHVNPLMATSQQDTSKFELLKLESGWTDAAGHVDYQLSVPG